MAKRKTTGAVFNRSSLCKNLYDHLYSLNGRRLNECDGPNGSVIEFWQLGPVVVLIQFYDVGGWCEYAGSTTVDIESTFARLSNLAKGSPEAAPTGFKCASCGREESQCSADPCEAVIADRAA